MAVTELLSFSFLVIYRSMNLRKDSPPKRLWGLFVLVGWFFVLTFHRFLVRCPTSTQPGTLREYVIFIVLD